MSARKPALALALGLLWGATAFAEPARLPARPDARRPAPVAARAEPATLDALVARARLLNLAHDEMWLRLIRYRRSLFGGFRSEADARQFFLSTRGATDPEAELEATIRALFGEAPADPKLDHPYCRFPARLAWLHSKLAFDFRLLPRRECARFAEYRGRIQPRSLVLVFSSYYLNNPASAFGHTFLRVNKAARGEHASGLELLDYGVDFSAAVDTGNPLIYAFKGLLGLFPGQFRQVPFYLKVREYNDYESRDLWEYELNLTDAELSMVIAHLWELGFNYFDYFYLSENCSYHVLGLLEVANPRFHLLDRLGWPVIPADTVKAVQAQPGLVRSVFYRPSNRTQARARLEQLSPGERDSLGRLLDDADSAFDPGIQVQSQARILDAALDVVDFRYARDLVQGPGESPDASGLRLKQRLLERRAALLVESQELKLEPPFHKMPHVGHDASRFGLGSGRLERRGFFHTLDLRLALHDLADPADGYPEEAAIEFMPLRLRYYVERPALSLEEISLIRVFSLTPLDRFMKKWSWKLRAGASRIRDAGCAGCLAAGGEFGAGFSLAPFGRALMGWAFADARLFFPVKGGLFDMVRAGVGPEAGLRLRVTDDLTLLASGSLHFLPVQEPRTTWELNAVGRWQYTDDFALSVEASAQPSATTAQLLSMIYF